jgi:hypothetical protein
MCLALLAYGVPRAMNRLPPMRKVLLPQTLAQ